MQKQFLTKKAAMQTWNLWNG